MPHLSKIYIASEARDKFSFLTASFGENFTFTEDSREADLIIVDLASPVKQPNWAISPPLILTAVDGPEDQGVLNAIMFFFPRIGPVRRKKEELEEALNFAHSLLTARRLQTEFLLQHLKKEDRHD